MHPMVQLTGQRWKDWLKAAVGAFWKELMVPAPTTNEKIAYYMETGIIEPERYPKGDDQGKTYQYLYPWDTHDNVEEKLRIPLHAYDKITSAIIM